MKAKAEWVKCMGYDATNPVEHDMRDHCTTCAPWWEDVPLCPFHRRKLPTSGFCRDCRKFYDVRERPGSARAEEVVVGGQR